MVSHENGLFLVLRFFPVWLVISLYVLCGACSSEASRTYDSPHRLEEWSVEDERVCIGTNSRLSAQQPDKHIRNMRDRYVNCTYVQGNLELTHIGSEVDLDFLRHIREVTGYVLISHNQRTGISLPMLRIIRGRTLFNPEPDSKRPPRAYALWVAANMGLKELGLWRLQEVSAGRVIFMDNPSLCHATETIEWDDLLGGDKKTRLEVGTAHFTHKSACSPCHSNCSKNGFCWGSGWDQCQKLNLITCAKQCGSNRCFGLEPLQCCHSDCSGGCFGPSPDECYGCKKFENDGRCVDHCPPQKIYDPETFQERDNPNAKLAYGTMCVTECPGAMLKNDGNCLRDCPEGRMDKERECVPCDGPCPKICEGPKFKGDPATTMITALTLKDLQNCTVIRGNLQILPQTFEGVMQFHPVNVYHEGIHPSQLEQLSTVKEITGFLRIDGHHKDMTDLSFLRNLETIDGRMLDDSKSALTIIRGGLKSLGLNSLKSIHDGGVRIVESKQLCYASGIAWRKIVKMPARPSTNLDPNGTGVIIRNNKLVDQCAAEGEVCHSECTSDGCWGPHRNQCLTCLNFQYKDFCLKECSEWLEPRLHKAGDNVCVACHEQCRGGCYGPGNGNCSTCLNVRDGPFCVASCPKSKYSDTNGTCQPCSNMCTEGFGCSGPGNFVGVGGCVSCEVGIVDDRELNVSECLPAESSCPAQHYQTIVAQNESVDLTTMGGKRSCRPCHPFCKKCRDKSVYNCDECTFYKYEGQCVEFCPTSSHFVDEAKHLCRACHPDCSNRGCRGPLSTQCFSCKTYRDYYVSDNSTAFNCTATCPPDRMFMTRIVDHRKNVTLDPSEGLCIPEDQDAIAAAKKRMDIIVGITVPVGLIMIIILILFILRYKRVELKNETMKIVEKFAGIEDSEPFTPTDLKPNTSHLRVIGEKELRRGGELGQGAFGYVYKGFWIPSGENKKIPVAIKVLKDGMGAVAAKDVMEEAHVMASVNNSYLVSLLGLCMTSQVMLVSQLLPLGSLLDYVKKNSKRIQSRTFLNWCSQIAKGMKYLEDHHMIHRDLAARNVLVQTPNWVKVTDFGLARMLESNQDAYTGGGRMPVRWLAPECIDHGMYTHKTDVWAFGVTVWEVLTYGEKPYENVPMKELADFLESGERLQQPAICSLDVYMLLLKCWSPHSECRPSFSELASEFAKMSRDPGRYLMIPGDEQMRLPDYTREDEQRMVQEAGDYGSEQLVLADEYRNPSTYRFDMDSSLGGTMKRHVNGNGPPGRGPRMMQENSAPVFSTVSAPIVNRGAWSVDRKDSPPHSRYALDPVKTTGVKYTETRPVVQKNGGILVGPDDYLQPTDHSPTDPDATYLDLTENLKALSEKDASLVKEYQKMPVSSNRRAPLYPSLSISLGPAGGMVHNPEYHLLSSGASNISTDSDDRSRTGPFVINPMAISDPDSDHEYYNDMSPTRRELIPLNHQPRRNETTV